VYHAGSPALARSAYCFIIQLLTLLLGVSSTSEASSEILSLIVSAANEIERERSELRSRRN
jgi:hypothetical protein